MTTQKTVHVVAAVLGNAYGDVLIAERPMGKELAGYWEFPGGKLEPGEMPRAALSRELREELGIELLEACPLIRFHHDYPNRRVFLDVWDVTDYRGEPHAAEGQALAWVSREALGDRPLLAADRPIVTALRLPSMLLVTPEPEQSDDAFLAGLDGGLAAGVRLVQFRAHELEEARFAALAVRAVRLCHRYGAWCVMNATSEIAAACGADGVHLSAARLMRCSVRPLGEEYWVGASCHDAAEVHQAAMLRLDYIIIGPVRSTPSHPGQDVLGWPAFSRLIDDCNVPAYAIGGMRRGDVRQARLCGGQGIAAIRSLWG